MGDKLQKMEEFTGAQVFLKDILSKCCECCGRFKWRFRSQKCFFETSFNGLVAPIQEDIKRGKLMVQFVHVYCYSSTLSKLFFSLLVPVVETAKENKAATQAKRRIYFPGGTSAVSQWVQRT